MVDSDRTALLQARGLSKAYAAPVLCDVDFQVEPGQVHALLGANGAGKSTLAKILCGLVTPDGGRMLLDGEPYAPRHKRAAEQRGVQIVQQELNLIGTLSVAENLFLSRLPNRWGVVRIRSLRTQAHECLARVGLQDLDPATPVGQLGVGQQQLLEIAAALSRHCRVLILDEPTAALTDPQIELLHERLRQLKSEGVAMVYISHRMDEVRRIADHASILRDGRLVCSRPMAQLTNQEILHEMAGEEVEQEQTHVSHRRPETGLRVDRLSRGKLVRDVSFVVERGEILGLAGLIGSGRTELLRCIFGADRAEQGTVTIGEGQPRRFQHPAQAVRAGLALIPEDRKQQGLLLPQSINMNATLGSLRRLCNAVGWMRTSEEQAAAQRICDQLRVRRHHLAQPVMQLSGGNQQKVVIARWLLRDPQVLLFDEPTRGIDAGARATLYHLLHELAAAGKAMVVVSSDLDELMSLCDRIGVMSAGRWVGIWQRGEWSRRTIMDAAFSEYLSK